jgi:hypothetical protein
VWITEGTSVAPTTQQVGRNDRCPCGSGKKYKQCCLAADEEKARKAREKAVAKAAREAEKGRESAEKDGETQDGKDAAQTTRPPKPQSHQPWRKSATNTHAFQRMTTPRKVGGG